MATDKSHGETDDKNTTRKKFQRTEEEDYGYYFYPERSGAQEVKSFWNALWGKSGGNNFRCEASVVWCAQNSKN
jgi:hypothetical protein